MTQQQHPITPPPELVHQWYQDAPWAGNTAYVADKAAQWGADQANADIERKLQEAADQELEACCEWMSQWAPLWPDGARTEDKLRAARRPKPKSLKGQAFDLLNLMEASDDSCTSWDFGTIRRALEQLDD